MFFTKKLKSDDILSFTSSPRLRTLAAALSPCYLRLGGTDADFLIFDPASTNQIRPPGSARTSHVQLDSCDGWRFCRPKYKTNFTMTGGSSRRFLKTNDVFNMGCAHTKRK